MRGKSGRAASRAEEKARAGVLHSTSSTARKRNKGRAKPRWPYQPLWPFASRNTRHETRITAFNLHFSPRGEAKCVRGPPGRSASRAEEKGARRRSSHIASFTPRFTRHEARPLRFTGHQTLLSGANRATPKVFTNHETRITAFISLHFSPRGEAKCVRGPSGRGARRLARAGVLEQYVEHGKQA